jgi:two-component system, chemotaxis family, protein-glutamate methylesterase/glutaminase
MSMEPDERPHPGHKRLRVLVVDDSSVQRAMLVALLDGDPDLDVVGWAASGAESVRAVARLHPDVITMDFRMPGMDGVGAARLIMQQSPTPIVMVTASVSVEDRRLAVEAFQAGILAIVTKPTLEPGQSDAGRLRAAEDLIRTIKSMAQLKVFRRLASEGRHVTPRPAPTRPAPGLKMSRAELVAIGASTGGPQVLSQILARLPADFPASILIVQHIADGFVASMVDWLRPLCRLPIELATAGRSLVVPGIHLAPTGRHLVVHGRSLVLTDEPPISGHRPSATALLRSVAQEYRSRAVGVLLTGMGDDGAAGLHAMKLVGAVTIAQDKASSVVFGMPAVAIELGAADHILPPTRIADLLLELVGSC